MRAVQVVTPTGPADLEIRDVDEPRPGDDDVLIEVQRVGVSFVGSWIYTLVAILISSRGDGRLYYWAGWFGCALA